jgi:hypothetical protein
MKIIRAGAAAGLLAMLLAAPVSAQVRGGLKGGITSATLYGDDAEDAGSTTGFIGGAFLSFPLSPAFTIQPELLFARKGASDTAIEDADADLRLSYLELPILAKFSFPAGSLRPHLFAGPYAAYRTGCTIEASGGGVSISFDCDDDEFELKKTDFGFQFGAGFDYDLGGIALVVDGRYGLGLVSLDDSEDGVDVKNRSFAFMAGFSIPLGSR